MDTPFQEKNIVQHFISSQFTITVKDLIPLTVTYFQRQSNSHFFPSYKDLRIELNQQQLQKIRSHQLQQFIAGLIPMIQHPWTKPALQLTELQLNKMEEMLNQTI